MQVLQERRVQDEICVEAGAVLAGDYGDTPGPGNRDDSAVATVLGNLFTTLSLAVFAWLTVLGFVGGAVPALGWQLPGGLLPGLAWLGVMSTLGVVVVFAVPLLVAAALARALSRLR